MVSVSSTPGTSGRPGKCPSKTGLAFGTWASAVMRPAAWSIKCNWRAWLVTANGLASDHLIATVTDGRLFAALHLILPDFPIIAVLAHLSGWEGL